MKNRALLQMGGAPAGDLLDLCVFTGTGQRKFAYPDLHQSIEF